MSYQQRQHNVAMAGGGLELYIGSVKLYKHIIYFVLTMCVLLAGAGITAGLTKLYSVYTHSYYQDIALTSLRSAAQQGTPLQSSLEIDTDSERTVSNHGSWTIKPVPASEKSDASSSENGQLDGVVNETSAEADDLQTDWEDASFAYQLLYPDLYNDVLPAYEDSETKTAYLTFDDGPSDRTIEVLDILKEYDIKATFFVITSNKKLDILERIRDEGHTIAIHTDTHVYRDIYRSVDNFLADFETCYRKIYETTSVYPRIFRFPGGSINSHNGDIYQEIIAEMLRRGYLFYDWNISSLDAESATSARSIVSNIRSSVTNQQRVIVLFHDSQDKKQTVLALPEAIELLLEKGYVFDKLDTNVRPVTFTYSRP